MKKYIVFILLVVASQIQAQTKIQGTGFIVGGQNFTVKEDKGVLMPSGKVLGIGYTVFHASSPYLSGVKPGGKGYPTPQCQSDYEMGRLYTMDINKGDFVRFYNIIRKVFSDTRGKEIEKNENFSLVFITRGTGKIEEIKYSLDENTIITGEEIAKLDALLKSEMYLTLNMNSCKDAEGLGFPVDIDLYNLYQPKYFGEGDWWRGID